MDTPKTPPNLSEMAHIGKSVVIEGELSGSEDLYVDGQVEGAIELKGNRLTVGPNGRVKASVNAQSAVVEGRLEGNIRAGDRVDLRQSAIMTGDISTQRISIEEGAFFKGGVDIQKEAPKKEASPEGKPEPRADSKAPPVAASRGTTSSSAPASPAQAIATEPRK